MTGRDSSIVLALLLSCLFVFVGCASTVSEETELDQELASFPDYPDQEILGSEEVIDELAEEDEFGNPPKSGGEKAGEMITATGYVAMIIASFVVPLLAL